jgi:hypothetical protein
MTKDFGDYVQMSNAHGKMIDLARAIREALPGLNFSLMVFKNGGTHASYVSDVRSEPREAILREFLTRVQTAGGITQDGFRCGTIELMAPEGGDADGK